MSNKTIIELSEEEVVNLRFLVFHAWNDGLLSSLKQSTLLALGFKPGQTIVEQAEHDGRSNADSLGSSS